MPKRFLAVVVVAVLLLSVAAIVRASHTPVYVTTTVTKYADGSLWGSGGVIALGDVAVHPGPDLPYGTKVYFDSPYSIPIKNGDDGITRYYHVFEVMDTGDPSYIYPAGWLDIWVGRWKNLGSPYGRTAPCGYCDGFWNGTCISSNLVDSCQVAVNWSRPNTQYHYYVGGIP